ncbi:MAG: DEAD/DEAH box helicase, partial [Ruminiclostridium sp.]|nr:DEAD/DEAH box helicase [Ruminiclostridium sp.]
NLKAYGKNLTLTEAVIFGGVGQTPQVEQIKRGVDILTATPGRLLDLAGQGLLDLSEIEIFVLDEADRMLDMGFIHDVRKVIKLLPEKKQTMFFSATMPPEIMDLVDSLLHDPVKVEAAPVSSPVEVIRQEVCLVDRGNKTALLIQLLEEENVKNALVFTRTKHGADKVARDLVKGGVTAAAIHGNKSQTARQESLRKFKAGELQVLVATDIAARGLDIEELSHVFNYNLSEVPETYIHRIGRTGRAGHGGTAISFCDYGEQPMLKDIEKLLKKPVPRREHDFPMEVFEAPKKDAKGRPINAEDAEARQAAREKNAARKKAAAEKEAARKAAEEAAALAAASAPEKKSKKKKKAKAEAASVVVETPPAPVVKKEKVRRTFPHGKQNLGSLQDFLDRQPDPDLAVPYTPQRNPLEGEVIMDATARLLASKPVYRYHTPTKPAPALEKKEKKAKSKKGKKEEPKAKVTVSVKPALPKEPERREPPKKGVPAPAGKKGKKRPDRKGGIPARIEAPASRQKDSTEQKSLMKPFYISHD